MRPSGRAPNELRPVALDIDVNNAAASLTIGGSVGGTPVADHTMAVNPGTTLGDVMREMQYALGINQIGEGGGPRAVCRLCGVQRLACLG